MPTYVSLINWTDQGIKNFRESTKRAEAFTKLVEASGGKVRELLWTVGAYDIVSVVEFPDEESGVAACCCSRVRLGASAATPCGLFQLGRSRLSSRERPEPFRQTRSPAWRQSRQFLSRQFVDAVLGPALSPERANPADQDRSERGRQCRVVIWKLRAGQAGRGRQPRISGTRCELIARRTNGVTSRSSSSSRE